MTEHALGDYAVHLLHSPSDEHDDNIDVEVRFPSGETWTATFFTLRNIRGLMDRYVTTKECGRGLYFWAADAIVIRSLSRESIETCVQELLRTNEFQTAFSRIDSGGTVSEISEVHRIKKLCPIAGD